MKGPFLGMDPYLEAAWGDVHTSLTTYARDQLQPQLPSDLKARVEETIIVEDEDAEESPPRWKPDVRVVEQSPRVKRPAIPFAGVAVAEPFIVEQAEEPTIERSLRIIDTRTGNALVTTIEFLSPTNKGSAASRRAFRKKQRELRAGRVSLVEIDLLRAGCYVLSVPTKALPAGFTGDYKVCVSRGWKPGVWEVYQPALRDRLPAIRIPLRESDTDVVLDLQKLVDSAYAGGAYNDIDYTRDPEPPLTGDDAVWADQLLRQQGKR
jgi:Protein of unknown function (DUF4058)